MQGKKLLVIAMIAMITLVGCGPKKAKPVIIAGDIKISIQEFDDAFKTSIFAKDGDEGHAKFVDIYITRKLMLREAEKMGLDKNPDFLRNVQLFWEQALLKLILAEKSKELVGSITVSDSDIETYYNLHKDTDFAGKDVSDVRQQIKNLLLMVKQGNAIQEWAQSLRNKTKVTIDYKQLGIAKK